MSAKKSSPSTAKVEDEELSQLRLQQASQVLNRRVSAMQLTIGSFAQGIGDKTSSNIVDRAVIIDKFLAEGTATA